MHTSYSGARRARRENATFKTNHAESPTNFATRSTHSLFNRQHHQRHKSYHTQAFAASMSKVSQRTKRSRSPRRPTRRDSRRIRRRSSTAVLGLQLDKLEELLCRTIQPYCHNEEIRRQVYHQFQGLADRHQKLSTPEIHDCITILHEVLTSLQTPNLLVSYIHSTIGLLHLDQGETKNAIKAFTKALWVQTATKSPDILDVGLSLHRIAICKRLLGDRRAATVLLERSLKLYKESGLCVHHPFVVHAQKELDRLGGQQEEKIARTKVPPTGARTSNLSYSLGPTDHEKLLLQMYK